MLKVFATGVVVSKGFNNAPALKYSENGDSVRFRFGKKVYDTRAENNTRWLNMSVKAFGGVCEHIKKMQLKEGSFINLTGRLDEDSWTDEATGETKSMMVIILDDIEYASGGGKGKNNQNSSAPAQSAAGGNAQPQNTPGASTPPPSNQGMPENFTGYESFGGESFFDEC